MGYSGMDLEAALQHARTLEVEAANEVFQIIARMTGIMPRLMEVWKGPDAARFEQEWNAHAANLRTLHGSLTDLVGGLNHSISAQRAASGD